MKFTSRAKAAEPQNNREQAARLALGALAIDPDGMERILRTCALDIRERIEKSFHDPTIQRCAGLFAWGCYHARIIGLYSYILGLPLS
jgi:hypothetical protein